MRALPRSSPTSGPPWTGATVPLVRPERLADVPRALILLAIAAYKLALPPLFTGACRHEPSCSTYAAEAVATHGALRGSWLAVRRLARCHPLGTSGYDPVPPAPVAQSPDRVPR